MAGKPEKELEVIAEVTPEQTEEIKEFLKTAEVTVEHVENGNTFDIVITVFKGEKNAKVRIANYHTNIVYIEKNGEVLKNIPVRGEEEDGLTGFCQYRRHRGCAPDLRTADPLQYGDRRGRHPGQLWSEYRKRPSGYGRR